MDLIDNDDPIYSNLYNIKSTSLPLGFKLLNDYCIIRLKTVRTKDDIIYLEPKSNLCLSVKLFLNLN